MNLGFVPIRKKGKLPYDKVGVEYELEYGKEVIEIHKDALVRGKNVVIVDDLLATGGTANAAAELIRMIGGNVLGFAFIIELGEVGGRKRLEPYSIFSLARY